LGQKPKTGRTVELARATAAQAGITHHDLSRGKCMLQVCGWISVVPRREQGNKQLPDLITLLDDWQTWTPPIDLRKPVARPQSKRKREVAPSTAGVPGPSTAGVHISTLHPYAPAPAPRRAVDGTAEPTPPDPTEAYQ
jgi:hypothetical protein